MTNSASEILGVIPAAYFGVYNMDHDFDGSDIGTLITTSGVNPNFFTENFEMMDCP